MPFDQQEFEAVPAAAQPSHYRVEPQCDDPVLKDLLDGRALVAEAWTRGEYARDRRGRPCPVFDPRATNYCSAGAIQRVTGVPRASSNSPIAWGYLIRAAQPLNVAIISDTSKEHALDMWDRAISTRKAEVGG